jgi:hypothetical protein
VDYEIVSSRKWQPSSALHLPTLRLDL